jgi:hypothetical protein
MLQGGRPRDRVPMRLIFFNFHPAVLWPSITHARVRQACARRETRLAFTCARKLSPTLLQLLARLRRVRIRIITRSVYRL